MSEDRQPTELEVARLIHLKQELQMLVDEWKQHGWGKGMALRFSALDKTLRDEPTPSSGFVNLSKQRAFWNEEQTRAMLNAAFMVMVGRGGGVLHIPTQEIWDAVATHGTIVLSMSSDDTMLTVTGSKHASLKGKLNG